jgi:hypothetical protein
MIQASRELDLAKEAVGCDADEELGAENLQRDLPPAPIKCEENPCGSSPPNLTIHLVLLSERLAHERQEVAPARTVIRGHRTTTCHSLLS